MNYQEFQDKYNPKEMQLHWNARADAKILNSTDKKYIWTAVNGDNGKVYLVPGYSLVNRLYYIICQNPWDDNNLSVKL